jgi:hypothetical protein
VIGIELPRDQRKELRQIACQAMGRVSECAHFVLLSDKGKSVPEMTELMDDSAETVCRWQGARPEHPLRAQTGHDG